MKPESDLGEKIAQQIKRLKQAERERATIWAQTIYISTLGLVMVLPIVGGAYLGHWLDSLVSGYSSRWTLSLLLTGVGVGIFNVYYLLKE